jgi:hypothetical protein
MNCIYNFCNCNRQGKPDVRASHCRGPDGKIYAHGSTTCLVFDMPSR